MAINVYELALTAEKSYMSGSGQERSYKQPDFKAAAEAVRVCAQIAGYLSTKRGGRLDEEDENAQMEAEAALEKITKRVMGVKS